MKGSGLQIKKGDWIRFQVLADRRVLEGFVQAVLEGGKEFRVGRRPDGWESGSFRADEIEVLRHQSRH